MTGLFYLVKGFIIGISSILDRLWQGKARSAKVIHGSDD